MNRRRVERRNVSIRTVPFAGVLEPTGETRTVFRCYSSGVCPGPLGYHDARHPEHFPMSCDHCDVPFLDRLADVKLVRCTYPLYAAPDGRHVVLTDAPDGAFWLNPDSMEVEPVPRAPRASTAWGPRKKADSGTVTTRLVGALTAVGVAVALFVLPFNAPSHPKRRTLQVSAPKVVRIAVHEDDPNLCGLTLERCP